MTVYRNPVVPGCYPDPSVCRVGEDFYLAASTFEYVPGIPILHSRDLVHWTTIGHAVADHPGLHRVASSQGLFAPTLRHIGGRFVMVTTVMPEGRSFVVTADDPAGPWSDPIHIAEDWSMDPSLFEDADGTVYYTRHGEGRHGAVFQATIDLATGELDGPPREIWRGTGGIWPEGPHLYRVGDWYYLLISEGGTSYEHSLTVARSESPWGPFEPCPNNPVLTHRDRPDHPFQAIGHADLVDTPDGAWFAVLLGIRPLGRAHHLGRETFLVPVEWVDGWPVFPDAVEPVVDAPGLPAPDRTASAGSDVGGHEVIDFTSLDELGPEWIGLRRPADGRWDLGAQGLVLHGSAITLADVDACTFVGRRQDAIDVRVTVALATDPVDHADLAGLVVRLDERHRVELTVTRRSGRRVVAMSTVDGDDVREIGVVDVPHATRRVELQLEATHADYAGAAVLDGAVHALGVAPTSVVSILQAEHFTGVVIGLFAVSPRGSSATFERLVVEREPIPRIPPPRT